MARFCFGILLLTVTLSTAAVEGRRAAIRPVMHVGAVMNTPYAAHLATGPTLSGGARNGRSLKREPG
jgi:hypothetical protein